MERLDTNPFSNEPDIRLCQVVLGAVCNKHLFKLGRSLDLDRYCGTLLKLQACLTHARCAKHRQQTWNTCLRRKVQSYMCVLRLAVFERRLHVFRSVVFAARAHPSNVTGARMIATAESLGCDAQPRVTKSSVVLSRLSAAQSKAAQHSTACMPRKS